MQVAGFLELVFNLPKNDRVLSFEKIATTCGVSEDKVEKIVIKAISINLVKGSIDELRKVVTTSWIQPKVL
jgi:26S proteasome regulatory subunit N9